MALDIRARTRISRGLLFATGIMRGFGVDRNLFNRDSKKYVDSDQLYTVKALEL
jgi:hypothetical protein